MFKQQNLVTDPELNDLSVKKIMGLLSHDFNDLKVVIDRRIQIRKNYDDRIKQVLYGKGKNKEDNANKGEIKILKNGLLESEEPEEDKEELDKIRHNIITRYLHENIVVELFMHAVKKAQQGTRDNRTDLFIENCGFLQTVEFDLKYIYDNTEISKTINISINTISKIARFVDQYLSNIDS